MIKGSHNIAVKKKQDNIQKAKNFIISTLRVQAAKRTVILSIIKNYGLTLKESRGLYKEAKSYSRAR